MSSSAFPESQLNLHMFDVTGIGGKLPIFTLPLISLIPLIPLIPPIPPILVNLTCFGLIGSPG